eukprot:196973_1
MEWATIATITYFVIYILVLFLTAFVIYKTEEIKEKKDFFTTLWRRRRIYGQVVVHLYDTATDIGVLIEWAILAYDTHDYESIDMRSLFYTSLGFMIAYRFICAFVGVMAQDYDHTGFNKKSYWVDGFLGFLDIYIIKVVYITLREQRNEPKARQKMIQLLESIFESLPQVVLQSVFIIRSWNDEILIKQVATIYLVGISLVASLFSIVNKFAWLDQASVKTEGQTFKCNPKYFKSSFDHANWWYLVRIVWRFSFVMTRFCILSLIWSVLGGAFLGIFLLISYLYWVIAFKIYLKYNAQRHEAASKTEIIVANILYGFAALMATPAADSLVFAVMHVVEMICAMSIITVFAFVDGFGCGICADPQQRQAQKNPFIALFLIAGWSAMVVDFIGYCLMLRFDRIKEDALIYAFYGFLGGLEED